MVGKMQSNQELINKLESFLVDGTPIDEETASQLLDILYALRLFGVS